MSLVLNSGALGWLYPAHLITDGALTVRAFGPSIGRAVPGIRAGESLWAHFEAERPLGRFDVARLLREREQVWLRSRQGLKLRGIIVDQGDELFFLVSYAPRTLRTDAHYQLQMWDFSPVDASLDALIAVEVQKALIAETQHVLDELTAAKAAAEASHQAAARPQAMPAGALGADIFAPLSVIAEVCRDRAPLFRARGVTLQAEVDPTDGQSFAGDAAVLSDAVGVMLDHALSRSQQGWVRLHASAHMDGSTLQVLVECLDTGATDVAGDGADLSAAAQAMSARGGRLERRVLTGVGVKSELKVAYRRVPAASDAATLAGLEGAGLEGAARGAAQAKRAPFRLLVVCSDPADLRLIEATLPPPAVETTIAQTEAAVLAALAAQSFDLALFDIHSGAFDLASVSQAARGGAESGRTPPIVLIGSNSVISHLDEELTGRVDRLAVKPLTPSKLLGLLKDAAGFRV